MSASTTTMVSSGGVSFGGGAPRSSPGGRLLAGAHCSTGVGPGASAAQGLPELGASFSVAAPCPSPEAA